MGDLARLLMGLGLLLLLAGGGLWLLARLGLPWPGRLPGDLTIQRDGFTLYLPFGTSILVSVLLSLLLYLLRR